MKPVNISHAWKYDFQNAWNWKLSLKVTLQLIRIKIKEMSKKNLIQQVTKVNSKKWRFNL
jgi:hypothetical protein